MKYGVVVVVVVEEEEFMVVVVMGRFISEEALEERIASTSFLSVVKGRERNSLMEFWEAILVISSARAERWRALSVYLLRAE